MYRLGLPLQVGQFQVFYESVPRQILFLRLLVIPGAARGTRVLQFDKKNQERTTLPSTTSDRQRAPSQTQKCIFIKWCDEMART